MLTRISGSSRRDGTTTWTKVGTRPSPTRPGSGEEGLYLGEHAWSVEGLDEAEGTALVEAINAHISSLAFTHAYVSREGDFVLWDNRVVLHKATPFDAGRHGRVLRRATTLGTVASGPPARAA